MEDLVHACARESRDLKSVFSLLTAKIVLSNITIISNYNFLD